MSFVNAFLNVEAPSWEAVQKGRHPSLDAESPIPNIGRRSRIGVRDNAMIRSYFSHSLRDSLCFINCLINSSKARN